MSSKYYISGFIAALALAAAPLFAADTFLITIGKDGSVRVGDKTVGLGDLGVFAATEARKDKEVNFQLSVDAGALADEVATVINICRQAGVSHFAVNEPANDNAELKHLYDEDQADRQPAYEGRPVDIPALSRRDDERERRVKELYAADQLHTGPDYYNAAMILQHALAPDDFLLCHDLSVVAIAKGEPRAKWLAAASMDRFLVSIGRLQQFGTQYGASRPGFPIRLSPIDTSVTDHLRMELGVPPLAELKQKEAKMDALFGQSNQPPKPPTTQTPAAVTPPAAEPARPPPVPAGNGLANIPFVLGPKKFKTGDSIVIEQVLANSTNLAAGDRVVVRGQYLLASKESATLLLVLTQTGGAVKENVSPTQMMKLERGTGSFELAYEVKHTGVLHLTYYGLADGRPFGGVYFGTKPQMDGIKDWTLSDYEQ